MPYLFLLPCAFLLGAVPYGWLVGKMRGVDIRTVGSKNIGATNVYRCVGKKFGVMAFTCDFLKGFCPVMFAKCFFAGCTYLPLAAGVAAVMGHMYTPFMHFKGGKGVATGFGMLMALIPALSATAFAIFFVAVLISHYISVGSIIAAAFLGIAVWLPIPGLNAYPPPVMVNAFVSALTAIVIWKHRTNIARLAAGCENKIY